MDFNKFLDRLHAANIPYDAVADALDIVYVLSKGMPVWEEGQESWHYKFDKMPQDAFTDILVEEIAEALRESTKARGITLFHGDVTDNGMKLFMDALRDTKAPIEELCLYDLRWVTDESLKDLPDIIRKKGIKNCDISMILRSSNELRTRVAEACEDVKRLDKIEKYKQQGAELGTSMTNDALGNVQKEVKKQEPKYPISDELEKIIMAMPPRQREKNRDSLASIQGGKYPPVKALIGVFTWTHDVFFAAEILKLLPPEKRAGLLIEVMAYYKEHFCSGQDDYDFFDEWIVRDLNRLADNGVIPVDLINILGQRLRGGQSAQMHVPNERGM